MAKIALEKNRGEGNSQAHPKALPFLFLTELWERFGFYLAQGLLILYMTGYFGFSDSKSNIISGTFIGLVYISPFVGGFLADKILGFKVSVIWGGLFLSAGYSLLGLSTVYPVFYLALATIIVGNGLFKPNISTMLGLQYAKNDLRRDSAFTIFYIGINLGTLLSGFSGYVKEAYGWGITFFLASIGMLIGLSTFLFGLNYIKNVSFVSHQSRFFAMRFFLYCLLVILGLNFILMSPFISNWLLTGAGIVLLIFLVYLTLQQKKEYRRQLILLNILIFSSCIFWALFLQLFISTNLFIERLVTKNLFGLPLTTTIFYASESFFIVILGPIMAWIWHLLSSKNKNPTPINKFICAIFLAGLSFLVLSISTEFHDAFGFINPLWVFAAYFILTLGELLLSPIGLSAVTFLSPPNLVGMMMGVWFVASGYGGVFAGFLAQLADIPSTMITTKEKLMIYHHAFLNYAYIAFFVAIILLLMHISLKKWLGIKEIINVS